MQINQRISQLYSKYNGYNSFWERIALDINNEFGTDYSSNAVRKKYQRHQKQLRKEKKHEEVETRGVFHSDSLAVSDTNIQEVLSSEFGVDTSKFSPKRIKTTATANGQQWFGIEWERKEIDDHSLDKLIQFLDDFTPPVYSPDFFRSHNNNATDEGHLLVPIMYDAHLDKASVDGYIPAYVNVAEKILTQAFRRNYNIQKILFVLGNDFGNTDNVLDQTSKGTPQRNSLNWSHSIDVRCEVAIKVIGMFSSVAPTDVIMVHGNHDRYSNKWLGRVVDAWFKNNPHVNVENGDAPRKYYAWESNMWGFVHGNEESDSLLPALMATESPQLFSNAKNKEVFAGHFHTKRSAYYPLNTNMGVTIRWMPALSGLDDWHRLKGYVGSSKEAIGIIYNKHGYDSEYSIYE